eukprot:scaffold93709_cov54-Phaeocystis_antarctica.AAC.1
MLTLALSAAPSWLDAGSLSRLVGRSSRADVLVLGCSAAEVVLFEAHRPRRIDCVSANAEDLEDAAAAATARGIVIEVHGVPPRAAYDLVLLLAHAMHMHMHIPCPCPSPYHAPVLICRTRYAAIYRAARALHRCSSRRATCTHSRSCRPR